MYDNRSICLEIVHRHDVGMLMNMYFDIFYDREPLTQCIGLTKEQMMSIANHQYYSDIIMQGFCWVARDRAQKNKEIGFIVCQDLSGSSVYEIPEDLSNEAQNAVYAAAGLLEEVRQPIYKSLESGQGVSLHIAAIGVAAEYEGQGVAKSLLEGALVSAYQRGFQYAFSECTSTASRVLHEKFGFECLKEVLVNQFVIDGKHPFYECELDVYLMQKVINQK